MPTINTNGTTDEPDNEALAGLLTDAMVDPLTYEQASDLLKLSLCTGHVNSVGFFPGEDLFEVLSRLIPYGKPSWHLLPKDEAVAFLRHRLYTESRRGNVRKPR